MTRAEMISNVVATTALLVSTLGFYYQYFTDVHDLRVSFISLEIKDTELIGTQNWGQIIEYSNIRVNSDLTPVCV